ncbi:hypothetical protein LY76DRAFT_203223 [Colletotrichum caudatum]|nr:hypothetical protein LY76DRAFT_203223 [Colletotrichum caudatum]
MPFPLFPLFPPLFLVDSLAWLGHLLALAVCPDLRLLPAVFLAYSNAPRRRRSGGGGRKYKGKKGKGKKREVPPCLSKAFHCNDDMPHSSLPPSRVPPTDAASLMVLGPLIAPLRSSTSGLRLPFYAVQPSFL